MEKVSRVITITMVLMLTACSLYESETVQYEKAIKKNWLNGMRTMLNKPEVRHKGGYDYAKVEGWKISLVYGRYTRMPSKEKVRVMVIIAAAHAQELAGSLSDKYEIKVSAIKYGEKQAFFSRTGKRAEQELARIKKR